MFILSVALWAVILFDFCRPVHLIFIVDYPVDTVMNLPTGLLYSEVWFCSDKRHTSILKDSTSFYKEIQISRCNSASEIKEIVNSLNIEVPNPHLELHIHFQTISETITALTHVSEYYIPEDQFRNKLSVFVTWPCNNASDFSNKLKQTANMFPLSSQVYSRFIEDEFWETYQIGGQIYVNRVERDNQFQHGFQMKPHVLRNNFNAAVIQAIAVDSNEEKFFATFIRNGSELTFGTGFSVELLNDLNDSLNFTVKAIAGQSYITNSNGSVGGMGAQLISKEADVIISPSYILSYRLKYLTASIHLHQDKILVFFRQPRLNTHKNIFINPFTYNSWISLVAVWFLLISSTSLMSLIRRAWRLKYYTDFYIWILGAICQKSFHLPPSNASHRIVFLTMFIMSFVVYAFYAASIISRLTVSFGALNSVRDLFEANFKFLADPLFQYSQYIQRVYSDPNKETNDFGNAFVNDVDSLQKTFQGGVGFVSSIDTIVIASRNLNISERKICDSLSTVPLDDLVLPLVFYFRKGSSLKEPFNVKLLNSMNRGLTHRYVKDFVWNTSPLCLPVETKSTEIISLSDISSAFSGLFLAFFISSFILLLEIAIQCKYVKQRLKGFI